MGLNANVLAAEPDVAAAVGTTLSSGSYLIMGLTVSQANFESIINRTANEEVNLLSSAVYNSSDALIGPAVIAFQIADCAYRIMLSLPGYSAVYFSSGVGDTNFDPSKMISLLSVQITHYKDERDRAFRALQNIMESGTGVGTADATPQGISSPQPAIY